jgi:hypothetical protein
MRAVIPKMLQRENSLDFRLVLLGGADRYKIDSGVEEKCRCVAEIVNIVCIINSLWW